MFFLKVVYDCMKTLNVIYLFSNSKELLFHGKFG